ncbi:MAG TPA: S8 family serine peptidase [Syntrophomonadaceae bacterium]|nr:S8 family serine peptidase [Syntrophomonadaceae bacterium]
MGRWRNLGKHCALLLITGALVAGSLFFWREKGFSGNISGAAASASRGSGILSAGNQRSGLFILNLEKAGQNRRELQRNLERWGAESGDLLDAGSVLVRIPLERLPKAERFLGSALSPYPPEGRLAPALRAGEKDAAPDQSEPVLVDVTLFRPEDKAEAARAVARLGGAVVRGEAEPGRVLRVRLPRAGLESLAGQPTVVYVEPVQPDRFLNDRLSDLVGATPLRVSGFLDEAAKAGLSGAGQIVGLADSGLDKGSTEDIHPDLGSAPGKMPKVVMLKSWAGAPTASDPNGHGTHMAATIAGTGAASRGEYRGIAPEASIYFQGLLNAQGELDPPPDLTALFEPAYAAGVRVHVNGWGGGTGGYLTAASQTDRFIRNHPDFLAVFAAGNGGPGEASLTPEAYTKNGLVVGASQSPHPVFDPRQSDPTAIAGFSSRGPTGDGRLKPELLAPGAAVSARSSKAAGGSDSLYTYMEGTSVAAAAAGGSAALLREYFQRFENLARPTAALLKAALICGARTPEGGPDRTAFGILDLGNTVLSLYRKTLRYVEAGDGVEEGKAESYTYRVAGGSSPLKVTLAWTDPEAAPGSVRPLVNNLDLVVRGPSGKEWRGNSFLFPDRADDVNNVEEVYIPAPEEGVYTIIVQGTRINRSAVSGAAGKAQDYALVFGQPLRKDVVQSYGGRAALASGEVLEIDPERVRFEQDERLVDWPESPASGLPAAGGGDPAGADIYLPPDGGDAPAYAYVAGRTWRAQGVQVVRTGAGLFCTEINPAYPAAGFFLAPAEQRTLRVNGAPLAYPEDLPPGSEVRGWINPGTQQLWKAEFSYTEKEGFLSKVDLDLHRLYLLGEAAPYRLSSRAALAYLDRNTDVDPADYPFKGGASPGWEDLRPGLKVKLMCSTNGGEVMYVGAQRDLVSGTVVGLEPAENRIDLSTGHSYTVPSGISLRLDGREAGFSELRPGYHVAGVLLPGSEEIIALDADSRVVYGRLVYFNPDRQVLYLIDERNNFRILNFSGETAFYRWGIPIEAGTVEAGCWARLYLGDDGYILRGDLAEVMPEKTGVFRGYDPGRGILKTDGGTYRLSGRTLVTKNGLPVAPEDLVEGEEVTLTRFLSETPGGPLLAAVAGKTRPGTAAPRLEIAAPWRSGSVIISGATSADRLYLYGPMGEREVIPVGKGGRFVYAMPPEQISGGAGQGNLTVQVVAVDTGTGGVAGQFLSVPPENSVTFPDLADHWAAADVEALFARRIVSGYPDGTFRPDIPISRAEFTVLLTGAVGWSGLDASPGFADDQDIPGWARPLVARARQRGLIHGYPDGRFLPTRSLSRAEAAVLLDAALLVFNPEPEADGSSSGETLPWQDRERIPAWAHRAVERVYAAGIMRGRSGNTFDPDAEMTRAEMASATCRLLEAIRSR